MAWNKLLPANSTKIRLTPAALQANWDAIETGGVPYDALRLQGQAVAPTRVSLYGFLYASDPGDGIVELFYEDDQNPAVITQLTTDGKIGTTSTQMLTSGISFDDSFFYTPSMLINARGTVAANGTLSSSIGIASSTREGEGQYKVITVADRIQNTNFQVLLTSYLTSSSASGAAVNINSISFNSTTKVATIYVDVVRSDSGALRDTNFNIAILGGR